MLTWQIEGADAWKFQRHDFRPYAQQCLPSLQYQRMYLEQLRHKWTYREDGLRLMQTLGDWVNPDRPTFYGSRYAAR